MTRRRRMFINSALVVALVLTAGGTWWFLRPAEAAATPEGQSVRSSTAGVGTVTTTIAAQGTLQSAAVTDVSFGTSGAIASVDVAVGTVVAEGTQLGTLDPATAAATASTTLLSPVAGTVTAMSGAVGDTVSAGTSSSGSGASDAGAGASDAGTGASTGASSAFVTISSTTSLRITASFDESDAAQLEVGQSADVTFPAVEGASATATVTAIDPVGTATSSVVTFGATITLDAPPEGVRLGQTASLTVTTAEAVDVLTVPSQAVTIDVTPTVDATTGEQIVTGTVTVLAADGTQAEQAVTVGVQGDATSEILSGLAEGDTVVISVDTAVGATETTTETRGFGSSAPSGGTGTGPQQGGGNR
ncbi:efflux RND transporter periplasmic adaptor subunit [Sanguibacter antarcticus]|nr:HlyD family efflux transporter periplasmic adaptor subunit [Sanguibacter antarcticus]